MDIGNVIKSLRKTKGINQTDLADRIEITQSYLSLIEKNRKEPNLSTLKRISNSLEIPLPIIFFMSLEEQDIPERKKEAFNMIFPSVNSFIESLFLSNNDQI